MTTVRAVGLLSGGLDSALAAKLMQEQGIEVIGLHLEAPTACRSRVRDLAQELGIHLEVRAKGEEYLRLLRHPRFGYGKNMNPCLDCRVFMFQLGQPYLEEFGARFLFSGEVLGQRPMSQARDAMVRIERAAGLEGWILRPLSARLLPVTEPERRGWVDRGRLLAIKGRGRLEQLALAERWGLRSFQPPGGGCLLTDPQFSKKLRDLFEHSAENETSLEDVALLRLGRHVRIGPLLKVVVGRDQSENRRLAEFVSPGRWLVEPEGFSGPSVLVCGAESDEALIAAVESLLRYSRGAAPGHAVRWRWGGEERRRSVESFARAETDRLVVLTSPNYS
jgi:tRNA-uridine 2-sulfurtransferase